MVDITVNGLTITTTHRKRLINNRRFNTGEIIITEYNIDEVLNKTNDGCFYYPKRIFSLLLHHMIEIIERQRYFMKSIYCFGLHQNDPYENPHDLQTMNKDIEVELDDETPLSMVLNNIRAIVNDMDERPFCFMDELKEGVRLTVVKIEILKVNKDNITMNDDKTFKTEKCMVCMNKEPNILFCNCGHICVCSTCRKSLNNKNKCVSCNIYSRFVREL